MRRVWYCVAVAIALTSILGYRFVGGVATHQESAVPENRVSMNRAEDGGDSGDSLALSYGHLDSEAKSPANGASRPIPDNERESLGDPIRFVRYVDLPDHLKDEFRAESEARGASISDAYSSQYSAYDTETIIALARSGDAPAEHLVVSDMGRYEEGVRREIALASAKFGRTFGLYSFGAQAFVPEELIAKGMSPPSDDRKIEGYGMIMAAAMLGDPMAAAYHAELKAELQSGSGGLSADQLERAEEYANSLVRRFGQ